MKRAKAQLKRYRQAVLKAAFEGKLTEAWRRAELQNPDSPLNKEPASALLARIREERKKHAKGKNKELPPLDTTELPEGWEWVRLDRMAWFKNGINFNKNQKGKEGILTIDVLNMYSKEAYVDLNKLYRVNKQLSNEYLLRYGDILFVRSSVKR